MPAVSIYWIADRLAPRLRKQFLAAVLQLRGDVSIRSLTFAAGQRSFSNRLERAFVQFEARLNETVAPTVTSVFEQSVRATETALARTIRVAGSFEIVNPAAIEAAAHRSSLLVRNITATTREGLQNAIATAIRDGIPPRTAAVQIKPMLGLTARQSATAANYRASLRALGQSQSSIDRAVRKMTDRMIRQRATNIARTETIRASNDGQHVAWSEARVQGLLQQDVQRKWLAARDERLCPICLALHRHKPVPFANSFVRPDGGTVRFPPAHPQCRCTIVLVFPRRRRNVYA